VTDYSLNASDLAPVVVGGIGGSGTRLIAAVLQDLGVAMPGAVNEALDNLWFSLLFIRRSILLRTPQELDRLSWLFVNAMRGAAAVPEELQPLLQQAADHDRGPALTRAVLEQARDSLLARPPVVERSAHWGWKQPNSHVMVPVLNQRFPQMRYLYVVRNGLDMAFSGNQNQLRYFWGDILLDGDTSPTPRNALRYWVAAYRRVQGDQPLLGERLRIVNFDALCADPASELPALADFLGLACPPPLLQRLAAGIRPPRSTGRHQGQDLGQFDPADLAFVRNLGFDVLA
jgi:hypothetical protein